MKSAKISGHLLLCKSFDPCVSEKSIDSRSGNYEVSNAAREVQRTLEFKKVIGNHQSKRAGFGSKLTPEVPPKQSYAYRLMFPLIVQKTDEHKLQVKATQQNFRTNG